MEHLWNGYEITLSGVFYPLDSAYYMRDTKKTSS